MNKVILAGRMTKPVEIKSLPSGSKVAVGSLASHDYRGGEERTEFHRLVFRGHPSTGWVTRCD